MVSRGLTAALLVGVCLVPVPSAQAPDGGGASTSIATDRPAIADSSAVVPERMFQAEDGLLETGNQARRALDFPETLIRLGVGLSTEVRFTAPDYYWNSTTSAGPRSGAGDLTVGVKEQLRRASGGFEIAAVLSLGFPTGANALSSHGYDPSFQLPWSRPLSSNWTAAGMFSVYVPTQNGSHTVIGESTFLVDRQLTGNWDAFAEYAGDFSRSGGPRDLLHVGTAYKIGARQQLDVHAGVGLSAAAVDHLIGIGYSFRLPMTP